MRFQTRLTLVLLLLIVPFTAKELRSLLTIERESAIEANALYTIIEELVGSL